MFLIFFNPSDFPYECGKKLFRLLNIWFVWWSDRAMHKRRNSYDEHETPFGISDAFPSLFTWKTWSWMEHSRTINIHQLSVMNWVIPVFVLVHSLGKNVTLFFPFFAVMYGWGDEKSLNLSTFLSSTCWLMTRLTFHVSWCWVDIWKENLVVGRNH